MSPDSRSFRDPFREVCRAVAFALLLLLLVAPALQAQTALFRGVVTDENETPLEGVQITITSEERPKYQKILLTDDEGEFDLRFRFTQYRYKFLFEKPGFQSFTQELSPTATRMMKEEFEMKEMESEVVESHGDLGSVVTGSSNAAIEAFNAGLDAQKEGELETAKLKFQEATDEDPTLGPAYVGLAQVLFELEEHEGAVEAADLALETKVSRNEPLRIKFQALRALDRDEEAEAIASQLEEAKGDAAAAKRIYNDAAQLFQAGDKDAALAKFQQAAEKDPSLQDAHHAIATIQLGKGNYAEAAESAETALDLGSEDVRTLRVLYDAYDALGRMEELTDIAPRLAAVDPEFGGPKLVEQAAALWNNGQADEAVQLARLALSIDPDLAKPHYFIGLSHLSAGENEDAKRELQLFIDRAPEDPEAPAAKEMLSYIE